MTKKIIYPTFLLLSLLLTVLAPTSQAAIESITFESAEQESLYKELIVELRCPKCQNQNIADSNAELATDLREKVYDMVSAGEDKQQIKTFMLERFGDFVLYEPQFTPKTWLLWLGPFLLLGLVLFICVRLIAKNAKALTDDD